jgi:hypothetical protein
MSEVRCVLRSLVCLSVSFGHREGFFVSLFDGESAWSAFEKSRIREVQEKEVRPVRGKKF